MKEEELIFDIESMITSGNGVEAAKKLKELDYSIISRDNLYRFSNLCRRSGDVDFSLKVLGPIIRSEKLNEKATFSEVIEYCKSLVAVGFLEEAEKRLGALDGGDSFDYFFTQAAVSFAKWDYLMGLQHINRAIDLSPENPYLRAVAVTNKIQALIALDFFEFSEKLLRVQFALCLQRKWIRLAVNTCDLLMQVAAETGNFEIQDEVQRNLKSLGLKELGGSPESGSLKKWFDIVEALTTGKLEPLHQARLAAMSSKAWESLRAIDYFSLKVRFDNETLNRLWFGTPHPVYRRRLEQRFPGVESQYIIGGRTGKHFDLESGQFGETQVLKVGGNPHKLLRALYSDLYRPLSHASLQELVYPGEYYDPNESYYKLYQGIDRLKKTLEKNQLPIKVSIRDGCYLPTIDSGADFGVLLSKDSLHENQDSHLMLLKAKFGKSEFETADVCEALNISRSRAQRLLKSAIESKVARCWREGRSYVYEIVN